MIRRLLYLNGFAAIAAVFYHATGWGYTAMFWWTDRYQSVSVPNFDQLNSLAYFGTRFVEQTVIVAIPIFLFVSGFFIAFATRRSQRTIGWNLIGVRVKNLLIPYLIWSVIVLGLLFALGERYSVLQIARMLTFGETQPPYYYVPLLIQLYLLAPLLVPWARDKGVWLLIATAFIQLTVISVRNAGYVGIDVSSLSSVSWAFQSWFFPGRIFWFSAGLVVGFHLKVIKAWAERFKWWLLGLAVITFVAGMIEWEVLFRLSGKQWISSEETLIDSFYSILFMLTFIAFDKMPLPGTKQIGDIGTKSFGIYLIHSPILVLVARIIYHIAPWLLAYQILFQPLLVVVGIAVPLLLMVLVKRSPAHPYYQYIFG